MPGTGKSTLIKMLLSYIDYLVVYMDYPKKRPYSLTATTGVAGHYFTILIILTCLYFISL